MHRKYGPVVRIMPNVIHVNDPSFIDKLYTQSPSIRRERAKTVLNMSLSQSSALFTRDHDLHRRRRAVMNRYFSQQNVRKLVPIINETLDNLLQRMQKEAQAEEPVKFNPACRAATKDVIQAYAFGDGPKCLHMDDFNAPFFAALSPEAGAHVPVHFHRLSCSLLWLPHSVIAALIPSMAAFNEFMDVGLALIC